MKRFDTPAARTLRAEITAALAPICKKNGITLELGTIRFRADELSTRLTAKIAKSAAEAVKDLSTEFETWAKETEQKLVGKFGVSFTHRGQSYTICGLNARSKYPVIAKSDRGAQYRWLISDVLAGMGIKKEKRSEKEIMADFADAWTGLSPENLSCDGEASRTHVRNTRIILERKIAALTLEFGREVGEEEAYNYGVPVDRRIPVTA